MGKEIEDILEERGHHVIARTGKVNHQDLVNLIGDNRHLDVAIEFTHPDAAFHNIRFCLERHIPVVSGTTGWLERLGEMKNLVEQHHATFLHSSNFSIGMNLFFKFNQMIAEVMEKFPEYRAEIEEIHHTEKVDSPSGTAVNLADQLISKHKAYKKWVNEAADTKEGVLGVVSKREPDVKGTHTIRYSSEIDDLEFTHKAHSRKGFALGAVLAAEWLKDKKGYYTMDDMLQLGI